MALSVQCLTRMRASAHGSVLAGAIDRRVAEAPHDFSSDDSWLGHCGRAYSVLWFDQAITAKGCSPDCSPVSQSFRPPQLHYVAVGVRGHGRADRCHLVRERLLDWFGVYGGGLHWQTSGTASTGSRFAGAIEKCCPGGVGFGPRRCSRQFAGVEAPALPPAGYRHNCSTSGKTARHGNSGLVSSCVLRFAPALGSGAAKTAPMLCNHRRLRRELLRVPQRGRSYWCIRGVVRGGGERGAWSGACRPSSKGSWTEIS